MRCCKAQKLISANLDGELDKEREQAVKAHLAECRVCRCFAADLPRCAAALDRLTVPDARPGFTGRVMARIPECETNRVWWRRWFDVVQPIPAGLGSVALCCGIALAILMNGQNGPTDSVRVTPGQSLYAGCFDPLPENSMGARYVSLVQEGRE